ncbi:hypothetical protein KSF73_11975 [Burkholderiaceae bacterium DAT-1]|nr:hypothetical protein [Burkholderiaceae bacterium DAT-1]
MRFATQDKVSYHGLVSYDQSGIAANGMLYPAPNVVGLLAAIATHAVIADSAKEKQKQELRSKADLIIAPYLSELIGFKYEELGQRVRKKIGNRSLSFVEPDITDVSGLLIASQPTFSLTQDQRAVVLDDFISIYLGDSKEKPVYQATIRIVSGRVSHDPISQFWRNNAGENLKDIAANLAAEAYTIAYRDASHQDWLPQTMRSVKYGLGNSSQVERAQVLQYMCGRTVLRTLRGGLMSVPNESDAQENENDCAAGGFQFSNVQAQKDNAAG